MFYYVSGLVAHIEPSLAVIDCGGVGYACRTTSHTISSLQKTVESQSRLIEQLTAELRRISHASSEDY